MQTERQSSIEDRFTQEVLTRLRQEIQEAQGQEILSVGQVDSEGKIYSLSVVARGNEYAVPALFPHMEKGDVVIHNHPKGPIHPSEADLQVATQLGNEGIGFFIVDNKVKKLYIVAEPVILSEIKPLALEALKKILKPGGPLSKQAGFYEHRSSQVCMLEAVGRAFNQEEICLIEAGTGVGKSLAYLIPAVAWSSRNEERVVVSTATINLQEQLYEKDLPLVLKLLNLSVPVALVKGRANYLCWTRLQEAWEEGTLFEEDLTGLQSLREWAESTPTGVRGDLPYPIEDSLWSTVCSESDICPGLRCQYREKCFFLKSRRQAASAKILVVNHHLLFSDLAFRIQGFGFENAAVLPPFHRIVFDEAHNLEQSVTSLFTETIHRFSVNRILNRLLRTKGNRKLGLAVKLTHLGASSTLIIKLSKEIQQSQERYLQWEQATQVLLKEAGTFRLTHSQDFPDIDAFVSIGAQFQQSALNLAETLSEILTSLPEEQKDTPEAYEGRMLLTRLQGMASLCQEFRTPEEHEDRILWLERKRTLGREGVVEFHSTPLDIAELMQEAVYQPFKTVIFTSATLTINKTFHFWKGRLGLQKIPQDRVVEYVFDSPFDYKNRVLLGVPTDAPEPDSESYVDFLENFIPQVCELTEGRALVLFTSYDMLDRIYNKVKPFFMGKGLTLYRQGEAERSRLLRKFNENVSSVLFATDSFWEGIDAPGETLEMVMLCRLPFRVPTDPIQVARMEALQKKGKNPFLELSLPEAVMKVRQGFGRLMRRSTDRGLVLIPDVRVVKKSYGKYFLSSLPDTERSFKGYRDLLIDIETFLARVPTQ
ncbi:MAG: helicase C-terminal domain-containing protein [Spirochaetales bacterium]